MTNDNPSTAPIGANENVPAANGSENALGVKGGNSSPLHEVLNGVLGTTYKSDEDAINGIKNTRDYVGKAGKYSKAVEAVMSTKGFSEDEAVKFIMDSVTTPAPVAVPEVKPEVKAPEVDTSKFISREEFAKELFYKDNPQMVAFKDVLDPLVGTPLGKTHAEVAASESFKTLVDAKLAQNESDKTKSVLTSGPRLGTVADKMTQAQEAAKAGNQVAAEQAATAAVIEAFGLK